MKKIAISIGDLNGIGLEIALRAHEEVKKHCHPIYCINENMLGWGAALLGLDVPRDFDIRDCGKVFEIQPGLCSLMRGRVRMTLSLPPWHWQKVMKPMALSPFRLTKNHGRLQGLSTKDIRMHSVIF